MSVSYIPAKDADALLWMQAFAGGIQANNALYQVSAADSATISAAVAAFAAAFAVSSNPATRTSGAVAAKAVCRNSAAAICRQAAMFIKLNSGISEQAKIDIGVRPVNPARQPIYVPNSSPLLNVIAATPGSQTVRYADSMTPETGRKPFGAIQIQIYVAVAAAATGNADAAQFYGAFTRNPVGIAFDPPAAKNDPTHLAAARELRDRYLEQVNAGRWLPAAEGKYDVGRSPEPPAASAPSVARLATPTRRALPAA